MRRMISLALLAALLASSSAWSHGPPPYDPNPPTKKTSTKGMRLKLYKRKVAGGRVLTGRATGFKKNEIVSLWLWQKGSSISYDSAQQVATSKGVLKLYYRTMGWPLTPLGSQRICARGETSKKRACASFRLVRPHS